MTKKITKKQEKEITARKTRVLKLWDKFDRNYNGRFFDLEGPELDLYNTKMSDFDDIIGRVRWLMSNAPKEGYELFVHVYKNMDDQVWQKNFELTNYSQAEFLEAETAIPVLIDLIKQGGFDEYFLDLSLVYSLVDFVKQKEDIASAMWEIVDSEYPVSSKKLAALFLVESDKMGEEEYRKLEKQYKKEE